MLLKGRIWTEDKPSPHLPQLLEDTGSFGFWCPSTVKAPRAGSDIGSCSHLSLGSCGPAGWAGQLFTLISHATKGLQALGHLWGQLFSLPQCYEWIWVCHWKNQKYKIAFSNEGHLMGSNRLGWAVSTSLPLLQMPAGLLFLVLSASSVEHSYNVHHFNKILCVCVHWNMILHLKMVQSHTKKMNKMMWKLQALH